MSRKRWLGCAMILALMCGASELSAQEELSVKFFNVGQGNCAVIICSNNTAIIADCGTTDKPHDKKKSQLVEEVTKFIGGRDVFVVLSHGDSDHYSLLSDVIKKTRTDKLPLGFKHLWFGGMAIEYKSLWSKLEIPRYDNSALNTGTKKIEILPPKSYGNLTYKADDEDVPLKCGHNDGSVKLLTVNAGNLNGDDAYKNQNSLVFGVNLSNYIFLFTGDAEEVTLASMLKNLNKMNPDGYDDYKIIWSVPHHGADTEGSFNEVMLENDLKPFSANISAGDPKTGRDAHPLCYVAQQYANLTLTEAPDMHGIPCRSVNFKTPIKTNKSVYSTFASGSCMYTVTEDEDGVGSIVVSCG